MPWLNSSAHAAEKKNLTFAVGVLMGLGWEMAFDKAMEVAQERILGEHEAHHNPSGMQSLGLKLVM